MSSRTYILHSVVLVGIAAAAWFSHAPLAEAKELNWRKPPVAEKPEPTAAGAPYVRPLDVGPTPKLINTSGEDLVPAKVTGTKASTVENAVKAPAAEQTPLTGPPSTDESAEIGKTNPLHRDGAARRKNRPARPSVVKRVTRSTGQSSMAPPEPPAPPQPLVRKATTEAPIRQPTRSHPAVPQPGSRVASRTVAYQAAGPSPYPNSPMQSAMVAASGPRPYPFKYMMTSQAGGPEIIAPGFEYGPGHSPEIYSDGTLTPEPLLNGWDGAVWPDEEVGLQDGTSGSGFPLFLSGSFGVQGYKGPADLGRNGNFGITPGFNIAGPSPYKPVGFQVGMRFTESNVHGDQALGEHRSDAREQIFLTAGIFRRADCESPWQWGVVFDWMHDEYWYDSDLSQVRFELSRRGFCNKEIGVSVNIGTAEESNLPFEQDSFDLAPTDLYTLFVRWPTASRGDWRVWGGVTGESDGLFGGDFWLPLTGPVALEGNFHFLFADQAHASGQREDSHGIGLNLVWYPCRSACGVGHAPLRPVLPVADNSRFFVDTVRSEHKN